MVVYNKEDYSGSSDDTEVPLAPLESGYISDSDSQPPSSEEEEEEDEPGIDSDDDNNICTPCDQLDDTSMDINPEVHVKEEGEGEEEEEGGEEDSTSCPLEQPQHTNEEPMIMPAGRPIKLPLKMILLSFNDDDTKAVNAVDEALVKEKKKKMPKGWLPRVALETVSKRDKRGEEAVAPVIAEEGEGEVKKVGYKFRKPAMIKSSVTGVGGMKTKSIIQVKREQERALKAVREQASFHL